MFGSHANSNGRLPGGGPLQTGLMSDELEQRQKKLDVRLRQALARNGKAHSRIGVRKIIRLILGSQPTDNSETS